MTTTDLDMYSTDLDVLVPDRPSFSVDSYLVTLADIHPVKKYHAREDQDQLILLAIRECFALYGSVGFDDPEYLVLEVEQILELDPDSTVDRKQITGFLDGFKEDHDPLRRDPESMEAAWNLIFHSNRKLHDRLVSEYSFGDFAKPKLRRRQKKAS